MSSLQTQMGQFFISFFEGDQLTEPVEQMIRDSKLGNVMYFRWANSLSSPPEVKRLSEQVHRLITQETGRPPIIAIDQEGGRVTHLKKGFSRYASNAVIAKCKGPTFIYKQGVKTAMDLWSVGINLNLAPVVDVHSNMMNSVIGDRSYSARPEVVIECAEQCVLGHHQIGVGTTLKHFPGHGDTKCDSHLELPEVKKSRKKLETIELKPFRALASKTDAIMVAHVKYPALDTEHPATLSEKIVTQILRKEMGYEGVVISDSLTMRSILGSQKSFEECLEGVTRVAIEAFNAGCDMLILGKLEWADFEVTSAQSRELVVKVIKGFTNAVERGEVSMEKVEKSLMRIAKMKSEVKSTLT